MTDSESDASKKTSVATSVSDHDAAKQKAKETREKLRDQMEFYFSDSNLTKDRFLRKEIENSSDGYVNVSAFLKFNKIRSLTEETRQVIKCLKHSDILELNDEQTMVRRRTAFVEPSQKDIDKKTIYVENLCDKSTNESIKSHFSQFGKVCYISLPKFKTSNESKGFAFVEFEDKAAAKKALEYYAGLRGDAVLYDHTTIGKFPKFNAQIVNLEKKIAHLSREINELESEMSAKNEEALEKKPKEEKAEKMEVDATTSGDESDVWKNLKVISKKAWLQLKEEYLNRQKEEINELKHKLAESEKRLDELRAEKEKKSKRVPKSAFERGCIVKMALDAANNEEHFRLLKMTRQQFKEAMLKDFAEHVAYVDVEKSLNRVLMRCKTAEAAKRLVDHETLLVGFVKSLLEGHDEDEYFGKIDSSRNKKVEKKEKKARKSNLKAENANKKTTLDKKEDETKPKKQKTKSDEKKGDFDESKAKKIKSADLAASAAPHHSAKHITFDD